MTRILRYNSKYLYNKREKLLIFLEENLNNGVECIRQNGILVGSGMLDDIDDERENIVWIAWAGGKPVAWSTLSARNFINDGKLQISVYVHPKFRKQGIGTKLIKRAKSCSEANGKFIVASPFDTKGHRFYTKNKIERVSIWDKIFYSSG